MNAMNQEPSFAVRALLLAVAVSAFAFAGCSRPSAADTSVKPVEAKIHVETVTVAEQAVPGVLRRPACSRRTSAPTPRRTPRGASSGRSSSAVITWRKERSSPSSTCARPRCHAPRRKPTPMSASEQLKNAQTDCQRYVGPRQGGHHAARVRQASDQLPDAGRERTSGASARGAGRADDLRLLDPRAVQRRHRRALRARRGLRSPRHARRHAPGRQPASTRAHGPGGERRQRAHWSGGLVRDRWAFRGERSPRS